ncbi:uncharacterized protein LOC123541130 [Mercenaria mercenaria]|uniref:uncharacterized protein LOC123541130 n=1 Tax=Mercenaria mercenaria TaxID=6596 RepID=UPI00234EBE5A|nr:uncharacterized protein LOC123541130 [Mercenaria mercenaria]
MILSMYMKFALVFASCSCFVLTDSYSMEDIGIKRFLHGCPFAFPCPPPPCENPVYGPHDCCGACPEPEIVSSTPIVADKKPVIADNFDRDRRTAKEMRKVFESLAPSRIGLQNNEWTTTTYPTTTSCPYPCTQHGYHYCYPLPCHIPCVDGVKRPGACCYECLNDPNCSHDDQIIPEGQNVTLPSGNVAFCSRGDVMGGDVKIYKVLG